MPLDGIPPEYIVDGSQIRLAIKYGTLSLLSVPTGTSLAKRERSSDEVDCDHRSRALARPATAPSTLPRVGVDSSQQRDHCEGARADPPSPSPRSGTGQQRGTAEVAEAAAAVAATGPASSLARGVSAAGAAVGAATGAAADAAAWTMANIDEFVNSLFAGAAVAPADEPGELEEIAWDAVPTSSADAALSSDGSTSDSAARLSVPPSPPTPSPPLDGSAMPLLHEACVGQAGWATRSKHSGRRLAMIQRVKRSVHDAIHGRKTRSALFAYNDLTGVSLFVQSLALFQITYKRVSAEAHEDLFANLVVRGFSTAFVAVRLVTWIAHPTALATISAWMVCQAPPAKPRPPALAGCS